MGANILRAKKVLMDVDTGIDDAVAIMVALQSPKIEIIGITSVTGNVTARAAALNTLGILRVMDKESKIPVVIGASRPLSRKIVHAEQVHGKRGLGNIRLRCDPGFLHKRNISDFLSETLANYRRGEVALIATGPLTNIAKAIIDNPVITRSLSKICIMGGAYGLASEIYGNITQHAEFNFYCDPKAAQIVMSHASSGAVQLNIVGLDVTDKYLRIDEEFISMLCSKKCKERKKDPDGKSDKVPAIVKSLLHYPLTKFGKFDLPDVFAVAMLERPDLFRFTRRKVDIIQDGIMWGHSRIVKGSKDNKVFVAAEITSEKVLHSYIFSRLCR
ncbi:MAG: nucleoside hydrolase [Thermoproteota archaeon]|nr:nucleoside hydrolase [Thermoproteota archaeon]